MLKRLLLVLAILVPSLSAIDIPIPVCYPCDDPPPAQGGGGN